jgi:hypothetical protein
VRRHSSLVSSLGSFDSLSNSSIRGGRNGDCIDAN